MKKNKTLFLILTLLLTIATTVGCTATKPQRPMGTQTRIGWDTTNDNMLGRKNTNMLGIDRRNTDNNITGIDRRNNNNIMGIDRRNMDNLSGMGPTIPNNTIRNNTGIGPNTTTNLAGNTVVARANTIAQRVANLKEVNNCSVLLSGNTAIVGVDIKNNLQGQMTTALKQKIEKTVKNTDNNITNVSVTADPDLLTRISNMATDVKNGRPISGFATEFQEILRRITPVR